MEKYITFSVPIKKKCNNGETISKRLRFIDSFRFMLVSLSDLVDKLSGIFTSKVCKNCTERKKLTHPVGNLKKKKWRPVQRLKNEENTFCYLLLPCTIFF